MNFRFGTKAETLKQLYEIRDEIGAEILTPYYFTTGEWRGNHAAILQTIEHVFAEKHKIIVRSSAKSEDSSEASMAGMYESIICNNNVEKIEDAIGRVIASYGDRIADIDQVLIQEAIESVDYSGVAFTRDPNSGGCYYVINYDDSTGSTSSITAGTDSQTKLFYWYANDDNYPEDAILAKLCSVLTNLIEITKNAAIDVEFLVSDKKLYILQVRPLVVKRTAIDLTKKDEALQRVCKMVPFWEEDDVWRDAGLESG